MVRTPLSFCIVILAAATLGGAAAEAADQRAAVSGSQCLTGERIAYTCAMGRKTLSVCLRPGRQVAYRYGPPGTPEMQIVSNGHDGRAFRNEVMTAGGGNQQHLRFISNGYEYVVYSGVTGPGFDPANARSSGFAVLHGQDEVSSRECSRNGELQRIPYAEIQFIAADDSNANEDQF
jgi:hypothetical protein